mmetsp:Transcript_21527/g.50977  ORF Transcript_21527/g.50977 Transcript_21527/m.50977 type:complete len:636 (-) Transcript_21527:104-2011(-)
MVAANEINEEGFDKLLAVASKRAEWAALPDTEKLAILEEINHIITKDAKFEEWQSFGNTTAEMMGFDPIGTDEGAFEATSQAMSMSLTAKGQIDSLISVYKIRLGLAKPPKMLTKGNFKTRKAINGQIAVTTFPSLPGDSTSFASHMRVEAWLDQSKVQEESQVEAFAFDKAWDHSAGDEGGLMVVLGAGNQSILTFVDIMDAMYTRKYVVYLKQHPIRNYLNKLLKRLLAPLLSRGYVAFEEHTSNERCTALIYHPEVGALHITGGKATHDLLVWGADPKEREQNLKANTPKIKNVTSELGAVSPWVIVPGNYTRAELESQAKTIAAFVFANASCNCNAPKCVVVADEWDQKEEFLEIVYQSLANHPLPVPYYPNTEQRWKTFEEQYPDAMKIESNSGMGIAERKLSAGGLNKEPLLLPYLKIETVVDLESETGREAASKEFAFINEPFAPVLTITSLKGTSQKSLMKFATTASTFCNEYLYGTLSGSITTPPSLLDDASVQTLIAEMKYGGIGVNVWCGFAYVTRHAGMWGGFPGETLDAVQSGIGRVGNTIAMAHLEKAVVIAPIVHPSNITLNDNFVQEKRKLEAVAKYFLYKKIGDFIELISAATGVDLVKVGLLFGTVAVAGCAYLFRK